MVFRERRVGHRADQYRQAPVFVTPGRNFAAPSGGPPYFSGFFDRIKKILGIYEVSFEVLEIGRGIYFLLDTLRSIEYEFNFQNTP